MILIPEQIAYLREERRKIKERLDDYKDYLSSREITSTDYSNKGLIGDPLTEEQFHRERANYKEILNHLSGDYQKERPTETIGIGTKFVISINGDSEKTETIILVDDLFKMVTNHKFITTQSLLGQNVVGKKEDDTFEYEVPERFNPRDKRKISGKILEIKKNPSDYLHFIREKRKTNRMSTKARQTLHEMLTSSNPEDKEKCQQIPEITDSQIFLLTMEVQRLLRQPKDAVIGHRLAKVRRLLETAKIAPLATDGTIGVGTRFKLAMTNDGVTIEEREYEMINLAVSDELENEYLERISPLGEKVYGLSENDTFTIREKGKTLKGIVTSVETPRKDLSSQNIESYQYQKK